MVETVGVNWSSVAAEAIRRVLAELAKSKDDLSDEDAFNRLRVSKSETDTDHRTGFEDGKNWAKKSAEYLMLEQIELEFGTFTKKDWRNFANQEDGLYANQQLGLFADQEDGLTVGDRLLLALVRAEPRFESDVARMDFWVDVSRTSAVMDNTAHVRGFCTGALAFWHKAKRVIEDD
jgi:hypothetical protein